VDVYINYLRKKLSAAHPDGDRAPEVIETVRGAGYMLGGTTPPPGLGRKGVQRAGVESIQSATRMRA
jgi:hypothetical protein